MRAKSQLFLKVWIQKCASFYDDALTSPRGASPAGAPFSESGHYVSAGPGVDVSSSLRRVSVLGLSRVSL